VLTYTITGIDGTEYRFTHDDFSSALPCKASNPTQIRPSPSEQGQRRSDSLFKSAFSKTVKQSSPHPVVPPRIRSPPPATMISPTPAPSTTPAPATTASKHPYSSIAWAELKSLKGLANKVVCQDDVEQMEGYNAEVKRFRRWFTPYKGKEACFVFKIYPKLFSRCLTGFIDVEEGRTRHPRSRLSQIRKNYRFNRMSSGKGVRDRQDRSRPKFLSIFGSLVQHTSPETRHQARKLLNEFPFAAVALFRSIEAKSVCNKAESSPEPGEVEDCSKGMSVARPHWSKRYVYP